MNNRVATPILVIALLTCNCFTSWVGQNFSPPKNKHGATEEFVDVKLPQFGGNDLAVPLSERIVEIVAETYGHPFSADDIPNFRVPNEDFDLLIDRFRDAVVEERPRLGTREIATMRLVCRNGESSRICVYWLGAKQTTICFSLNGVRCITSHSLVDKQTGRPLDHALFVVSEIHRLAEIAAKK